MEAVIQGGNSRKIESVKKRYTNMCTMYKSYRNELAFSPEIVKRVQYKEYFGVFDEFYPNGLLCTPKTELMSIADDDNEIEVNSNAILGPLGGSSQDCSINSNNSLEEQNNDSPDQTINDDNNFEMTTQDQYAEDNQEYDKDEKAMLKIKVSTFC